ncbi:uncharacterized protein [Nicotiana sylvestris]|uniref:uncharacterized protein n=1 Tax=Nicotiana sylvestris TaxID=4096 RepID=UPI00388C7CAC
MRKYWLPSSSISAVFAFIVLPHFIACSSNEEIQLNSQLISINQHVHKVNYHRIFEIEIHGILLWASMGFLMPAGILTIRMSNTEKCSTTRLKVLFYVHGILQVLSVLLATAGAVLSIKSFENMFNNNHQRIGLALYIAIYVQFLMGFRRPKRGSKGRSVWFFFHWLLGTTICLAGIINTYTGLSAYHERTSKPISLWTIIFTAQISFMGFFYLFQDKWEYIQKQGIILGNNETMTPQVEIVVPQSDGQKMITRTESGRKSNALGTYFSRNNVLNKLFSMGEEGENNKEKKRVVVESLGWLTESTIMPKKHRPIEGVGASSILELKAQLYKSQEESKRLSKETVHPSAADPNYSHLEIHRAKKKITAKDAFSSKNHGVDAREAKDKLELKAVKDGSVSYAALERKAKLYDKLVRGELSDGEDEEKYCVDFFRKGQEQVDSELPQRHNTSSTEPRDEVGDDDTSLLPDTKAAGLGRQAGTFDRSEHKRFVMEVHKEASQAREKASELKLRRQEQVAARREKLKQAYLRKQLEKSKASKTEQT